MHLLYTCTSHSYFQDKKYHRKGSRKRRDSQLSARHAHNNNGFHDHTNAKEHQTQTPADIFTVNDLQESKQKSNSTELMLQQLHDDLKACHSDKDSPGDSALEWTLIAMVLDRIFLVLFLLVSFMTSLIILLNRPEYEAGCSLRIRQRMVPSVLSQVASPCS